MLPESAMAKNLLTESLFMDTSNLLTSLKWVSGLSGIENINKTCREVALRAVATGIVQESVRMK